MKHTTPVLPYSLPSDRVTLLLCIGISLVCWFSVKLSSNYTTKNEVNLLYQLPEGKVFISTPPRRATVHLDGIGWRLITNQLPAKSPAVKIDLSNLSNRNWEKSDFQDLINDAVKANNPYVDIKEVKMDNIDLALSEACQKKVPIVQNCTISFREGYGKKSKPLLSPDSVTIKGPKSVLEKITEWHTVPQSFADVPCDIAFPLALVSPDNDEIRLSTSITNVEIPVEQITERIFMVPIVAKNSTESLKFIPDKVKVAVQVGLSRYDAIAGSEFTIEADMQSVPNNAQYIPIKLAHKPFQIDSARVYPSVVSVYRVKRY
jgi:hypothetical protein